MHRAIAALAPILALAIAPSLLACSGVIADPSSSGGTGRDDPDDGSRTAGLECHDPAAPNAPLRRLTQRELERTLQDLLGPEVFAEIELDFGSFPADDVGAGTVGSFQGLHSTAHAQAMVATGQRAARAMRAHPAELMERGHGCMLEAAPDPACVRDFVERFGLRVHRRPLTDDEIADHLAFYDEAPDPEEGFTRLVMRLLGAPELLFHVEVAGVEEDGVLRLDPYAIANRIAYMVLGSMPDDALLAAAAAGELDSLEAVEGHVRELLDDPRAQETVAGFFEHWVAANEVPGVPEDPALLDGLERDGLREALLTEVEQYVDHLIWVEDADYRTLMTSPLAFPEDERVAAIYGVAPWAPGEGPPSTGPERGGLLLRAGLLVADTHATAPILRGVFVRRQVLCDELPSPDGDIVASRLDELGDFDPATASSRQLIEALTGDEPCASCHQRINPIAFAMENFDRLGRHRDVERAVDDGRVIAEHPVDSSADVDLGADERVHVESGAELMRAIADSEAGHACFVERLFEHTRVRRPESEAEHCQIASIGRAMHEDGATIVDAIVANVANESLFIRRLED